MESWFNIISVIDVLKTTQADDFDITLVTFLKTHKPMILIRLAELIHEKTISKMGFGSFRQGRKVHEAFQLHASPMFRTNESIKRLDNAYKKLKTNNEKAENVDPTIFAGKIQETGRLHLLMIWFAEFKTVAGANEEMWKVFYFDFISALHE